MVDSGEKKWFGWGENGFWKNGTKCENSQNATLNL